MNIFSQLYEQILAENEKLKAQLHDTNMELTDLKLQLEKTTQVCIKQKARTLLTSRQQTRSTPVYGLLFTRHQLCFLFKDGSEEEYLSVSKEKRAQDSGPQL